MKAVILAGGFGTRLSEETVSRPKPMVEVAGKPILWHIMKIYAHHGITDFVICLGYKSYIIKEFFANYCTHNADVTIDMQKNEMTYHSSVSEPWKVSLIDTGHASMTGGRLKRVSDYLDDGEDFCFTYGDGVADVDISRTIAHHKEANALASVTAVQPPGRFGILNISGHKVLNFSEKPSQSGWVNGGFFVLNKKVLDLIPGDSTSWEREPMEQLAESGQLNAYFHNGFWQPMDTLRDKNLLEDLWNKGEAPWKVW